jgi:hypothetical protein
LGPHLINDRDYFMTLDLKLIESDPFTCGNLIPPNRL